MNKHFLPCVLLLSLLAGCTAESPGGPVSSDEGAIRLTLSQEVPGTKSDLEDLPSLDDFEVEIYNANTIRLYRDTYARSKDATIKLNAGEFRLVAHHGDTLGAGFGKAYFLADQAFTVHGYVENNGQPDQVSATARLANVRMRVQLGNSLRTSYKDAYVVVRHARYAGKQVKFTRDETRYGYMPGGELYLEVYAQLFSDEWKYYKSEATEYLPNDNVTFNVEAAGRDGSLAVSIAVDRSVETIEVTELIGENALPARAPYFVFDGDKDGTFAYSCNAGLTKTVNDAILTLSAGASTSISSVTMHTESAFVSLPDVDLVSVSGTDKQRLTDAGLDWMAGNTSNLGYVDFNGLVNRMLESGSACSATFTLTLTDGVGQTVEGTIALDVKPFRASVNIPAVNIWAWKMTDVTATVADVDAIPADVPMGLQWSTDGRSWSTEKAAVSVSGNTLRFGDIAGLAPATAYRFRVVPLHLADRASVTAGSFTTEAALQVGNSGFEEITAQSYTTPVAIVSDFKVTWWQLYGNASNAWWGVNAMRTIEDGRMATGYQDYKTYPCVAVFNSGSYSGNSVMLATVYIGSSVASEVKHGDTNYPGEIFLGTANNKNKGSWAKTSEGHAFSSRPSALSFMHRFNPNGAAYYAQIQVLDASGNVIGIGEKNDGTAAVNAWTRVNIPVTYTVTDRKAASIRISIRSSKDGGEEARKLDGISTLSGSHKIYCGNALYVDNVELLYQ
ncbi:MAG: DUF4493 domain-containing protein [Bacteroidales bacterium]|nr:DUF4493 domain-containing protein [Bacteroidales bacterium]